MPFTLSTDAVELWAVVFWAGLGLLFYVYAGYPLVLRLLRSLGAGRPVAVHDIEPRVTLVISAFNEQAVIADKLRNTLALDYPRDRLEVLVVSDASDDDTDAIVAGFGPPVRLLRMAERGGKTLGLNAALAAATGEIVVFSDANALYNPDAIRRLVRNFADPTVGAVTGESRYLVGEQDASTESEDTYWSYEIGIKSLESALGSVVGGDGAIYAIRRSLYRNMAASDLSDFVNPLQIVAQGYRNVYEPTAVSWEGGAEGYGAEYRRKVRIVNRAWRATWKMRGLLNPFRSGLFAWQFLSHKVLRWLVPWILILVLVANALALGAGWIYQVAFAGQLACYAVAILGALLVKMGRAPGRLVSIPYYFCLVNWASLVALVQVFTGRRYTTWTSSRPDAPGMVAGGSGRSR
jgi:cellulose synthase/poly-beta-1,6-N-acetylglucosamine synthase-like glycosyltransferase